MTTTVERYETVEALAARIEAGDVPDFGAEDAAATIVAQLPDLLDEAEAAADVARETRARVDRAVRVLSLARQRGATAGLDLTSFRRLGLLEAGGELRVSRPVRADGAEGPPRPHLFRSLPAQHRKFRTLVAVPSEIEEQVRRRLEGEYARRWVGTPPPLDPRDVRDAVREAAIEVAVKGEDGEDDDE